MKLSEKTQKVLWGIFAGVLIISAAAWMILNPGPEHIEDTNGAENYELQTITDDNIINQDMGAMGFTVSTNNITNMTEFSSKKFTGVHEVVYSNLLGKSDFVLNLYQLSQIYRLLFVKLLT